jgi:hypothetical protein
MKSFLRGHAKPRALSRSERAKMFVQQCQVEILAIVHEIRRNRAQKERRPSPSENSLES